jgi:apolipoprotein N-acyltransferase
LFVGVWLWPATTAALSVNAPAGLILTLVAVQVFGGLYVATFLFLCDAARRRSGLLAPFVGAALWVALEFLRAHLFGGYPWGLAGHTLWQQAMLIQVADFAGVYGVSFVIVAVNVALADALVSVARRRWGRDQVIACASVSFVVAGTMLYGAYRLASPTLAATVDVQVVHTQWEEKGAESAEKLFQQLIELTSGTAAQGAELVVWPENSIRFYVQRSPQAVEAIRQLLVPRSQYLLAGGPHYEQVDSARVYHNSAYLFDPTAQIVGRHDKTLLVPLAEQVMGGLPSVERSFRRGGDARPLRVRERTVGALICFEAIYPHVARQLVRHGATVLINPTSDQLIGVGASQQAAMAVFRAVENRVPLVRVSNLGPSLSVDPFGHVTTLASAKPGSVVLTVTVGSGSTPYNRVGDLFALVCLAVSVVCGVVWTVRARTIVRP